MKYEPVPDFIVLLPMSRNILSIIKQVMYFFLNIINQMNPEMINLSDFEMRRSRNIFLGSRNDQGTKAA
jgi:hypothetical protein